jgi:hypothetical protein
MLIALLILIGSATLLMLILWLTSRIFAGQPPVPVLLQDITEGDGSLGGGMELDAPDADQIGLETDLEEPMLEETLAAVADVIASNAAILDNPALTDQIETGRGGSTGRGGTGRGYGTGPGTGRGRHWEVRFSRASLNEYAAQLDAFGIEIGVVQPGNRVEYASRLSQNRPQSRAGPADQDKRYYLTWRRGELEQFDRQLLDRAGIEHQGRLIVKFLPPQVESQLVQLERDKAGAEADDVRATYFGVRRTGGNYTFYVIDQTYR